MQGDDLCVFMYSVYSVRNTLMSTALLRIESTPDLVDQVYRALLDAISEGSLPPGHRITQEEMADQLAVSRQPVMQALRLLKKDGFVQDAPGRGLQVSLLEPRHISQVYEVRSALDTLAARLAAQQKAPLDPALFIAGRGAVARGDVKAMIDADLAFHGAIYRAAGNPLIEQSASLHWHHIRRAMGLALREASLRDSVWDEHQAIADAITAGNAERAERLMRQHCGKASAYMVAQLATSPGASPGKQALVARGPATRRSNNSVVR
jgi:DNA-binding GntR family transcriptional regulator